jgi:hypothetical protein
MVEMNLIWAKFVCLLMAVKFWTGCFVLSLSTVLVSTYFNSFGEFTWIVTAYTTIATIIMGITLMFTSIHTRNGIIEHFPEAIEIKEPEDD